MLLRTFLLLSLSSAAVAQTYNPLPTAGRSFLSGPDESALADEPPITIPEPVAPATEAADTEAATGVDPGDPVPLNGEQMTDEDLRSLAESIENSTRYTRPLYREVDGVLYPIIGYREAPVISFDENREARIERTESGAFRTKIVRVADPYSVRSSEAFNRRLESLSPKRFESLHESMSGGTESVDIGDPIPLTGGDPPQSAAAGFSGTVDPFFDGTFLWNGRRMIVPTTRLLPPPSVPNSLFHRRVDPDETRMSYASRFEGIGFSGAPDESLLTRFLAAPHFGFWYDTGRGATPFRVQTIGLGEPIGAGRTTFTSTDSVAEAVPLNLLLDNQVLNLAENQVQVYVEANNHQDRSDLDLEHVFARLWDTEATTVTVGKTHSLFGIGGLAPATIVQDVTLIGTGDLDDNKRGQLRLQTRIADDWSTGIAVEDPFQGDLAAMGDVDTRWPTFAGNLAYKPAGQSENILQFSALMRSLGFERTVDMVGMRPRGREYHATAWGFSAYARLPYETSPCSKGNVYAGIAGGEGLGQYISGVSNSAVFTTDGEFSTLKSLGSYIGFTHVWDANPGWELTSNGAFGYSSMETPGSLAADTNRRLTQGWMNLILSPSERLGLGVEYHYGHRETRAMGIGENHRFLFVIALQSAPSSEADDSDMVKSETNRFVASSVESYGTTETQQASIRRRNAFRQVP